MQRFHDTAVAGDNACQESRWVLQLYREWRRIRDERRLELKKPLIELFAGRGRWGYWDADRQRIGLSRHLVREHSWEVVVQVLKHEMAHQLVWEQQRGRGHGALFRRAADLLGLDRRFAGASGDLPVCLEEEEDERRQSLRRRIGKLFDLAGSANEHEAGAAMAKARQLMLRYNIDAAELGPPSCACRIIELKRRRVERWHRLLCAILMEFYFVDVVLASLYDARDCREYRTIEVFGTPASVENAVHVFSFLAGRLDCLWREYRRRTGVAGRHRNSYWLGVLEGFRRSLRRQPAEESMLPVKVREEMARYIRRRHPRLHRRRQPGMRLFADTWARGHRDGRTLRVRPPVATVPPAMLPPGYRKP